MDRSSWGLGPTWTTHSCTVPPLPSPANSPASLFVGDDERFFLSAASCSAAAASDVPSHRLGDVTALDDGEVMLGDSAWSRMSVSTRRAGDSIALTTAAREGDAVASASANADGCLREGVAGVVPGSSTSARLRRDGWSARGVPGRACDCDRLVNCEKEGRGEGVEGSRERRGTEKVTDLQSWSP